MLDKFLKDLTGVVKPSVRPGRIGRTFFRSEQDWSRVSASARGLVKCICGSRQDWSHLQEHVGFYKLLARVNRIGQSFCVIRWDCSHFL